MPSSEGKNRWVTRWRYVMAPTSRPGTWRLKDGGYAGILAMLPLGVDEQAETFVEGPVRPSSRATLAKDDDEPPPSSRR